jgi:hypothetical protein
LRRLRERAGARQAPKSASRTKEVEAPRSSAVSSAAWPVQAATTVSSDDEMYSFGKPESLFTAQFGSSLDRGEGLLEWLTVEAPEPEIEAVPYLSAGLVAEHVPYLNLVAGEPKCTGSVAPPTGRESQESSIKPDEAIADSNQNASYLCGIPISRATGVVVAEYVPYLNAATDKPHYMDSLALTSAPDSQESSFQSDDADDAVVYSVVDRSEAAPYLEGRRISLAAAVDIAEQAPYLNALTGKPCYMDSLAPSAALELHGSLEPDDMATFCVMDSTEAAPYLDSALTLRSQPCPYLQ